MTKLFANSISMLAYVERLDAKIYSIMQMNNNQINTTLNSDFEKIFPSKNLEAVNDLKIKLNLDENTSVQLVCMLYMFNTFYYKTNKLFKEFCIFLLFLETSTKHW